MTDATQTEKHRARAEALANALLEEWLGPNHGYTFRVNGRLTSTFGRCNLDRKSIEIARWLVESGDWTETEDTVRHEVAHAVAYERRGCADHGREWKLYAGLLGARNDRAACGDRRTWAANAPAAEKPRAWDVKCADCHEVVTTRKKKPTRLIRPVRRGVPTANMSKCCGAYVYAEKRNEAGEIVDTLAPQTDDELRARREDARTDTGFLRRVRSR